jgi:O-acetyl-ADP-ribose deacetylase (regulator of RNase III)
MMGLGMGPLPFPVPLFGNASASERAALRDRLVEALQRLETYGTTSTSFPSIPTGSLEDYLGALSWFAEEVIPILR